MKTSLADTLLALVAGLAAAPLAGLKVSELQVELPLEVSAALLHGQLTFMAQAPHSRWAGGFLPPVQRVRMRWALEE